MLEEQMRNGELETRIGNDLVVVVDRSDSLLSVHIGMLADGVPSCLFPPLFLT